MREEKDKELADMTVRSQQVPGIAGELIVVSSILQRH